MAVLMRDLMLTLKKETCSHLELLSKVQPMPPNLYSQIFKGNALDKPTQNLFNHISYYLISIIDVPASASLPWPLYDTSTERAYRNKVSSFISEYSSQGLLSPVMSSYLVNPGCYKVTLLLFQLSQLAVQKLVKSIMRKDSQKKLYDEMTEKFKSEDTECFIEQINKQADIMLSRFSYYMHKRRAMEKMAEKFRVQITKMETTLKSGQQYLNNLVDGFVKKSDLDDVMKKEFKDIKNVNRQPRFFDSWLLEMDKKIQDMESKWSEKVSPFLQLSLETQQATECLISRHTGEADKDTYMLRYNHETEQICTKELQAHVNSEQKFILRQIVIDEKLNFPNLIRGFLIAISFMLRNLQIGDEIFKFNEYLDINRRHYSEVVETLRGSVEKVANVEAKLQPSPLSCYINNSLTIKGFPEIEPLPDLCCLSNLHFTQVFNSYTPLYKSKNQFNLRRKTSLHTFIKPLLKSLRITPILRPPKENITKSLVSCHVSLYDHQESQNINDLSVIPHYSNKVNETIAECGTGFTKDQFLRLVSTKKSSSSKKFKYKTDRPNINIKKGGLFNETNVTLNESNGLFRSYSSPNLYEDKDRRIQTSGQRKLSVMVENSPTALEVSGIVALDKDSGCEGSECNVGNCEKMLDTLSLPHIVVNGPEQQLHNMYKDFKVDLNKEFLKDESNSSCKSTEQKTETPKNKTPLICKTSSLEKLINRFKKVRTSATDNQTKINEFHPIVEERDNTNANVECTANKILLPDLLSPSGSFFSKKSDNSNFSDIEEKIFKKPRESLGTMLGVDHTFLDQFDLVD